ncbi:MAG: UDP-N-acetylmuramoyl-tripeptide--D-alanyl-D-alanine ligase [Clostridiales bacterium]|nr:UDP-N-acetylmuramoyl-tripeptide--D-alanyl-D-alanine ligase [Clostridiales bacterium]
MFPIGVQDFSQLLEGDQILLFALISITNALFLFFASMKFILVLQQCSYRPKRYFEWINSKTNPYMSRLMLLCMLALLFFCVLNMTFIQMLGQNVGSYLGFASYIMFSMLYIKSESSINAKVPLRKTARIIRLSITYIILLIAINFGLIILFTYLAYIIQSEVFAILRFAFLCVLPILIPFILFLAYCINEPLESSIRKEYIRQAIEKLNKSSVIKIGITGSFAKTSVKEILKTILSQKYRVLATPSSFNTPLGISKTVQNLDSTHDVFIAEMGARQKGDIKELAKIVRPKYGILTGVNNQHLQTFGKIETTMDTKFELFENLEEGGVAIFSSDNDNSKLLFDKYKGEKYLAGQSDDNNLVKATDIVMDARGTTFNLIIGDNEPMKCSTVLLGSHSVSNICLASAMAYKLGLTPKEIAVGIGRLQSIGHRLELLPNNKNIIIIDDSYNSNEAGIDAAISVLDNFKGRKIVLTPGLIELGKVENLVNYKFGKKLATHADLVFVIGRHNAEMLIKGLLDGGMDRNNVKFAKSLNKGNAMLNEILQEGDIVLFENDLPDNYN